jgi:hypothetical protein
LLTEEEKGRIRREHRSLLEKRQHDLENQVFQKEQTERDKAVEEETQAIIREEEDKFYQDKPEYVKVKDRNGNVRWILKSEYEQKKYRKYKVRKKRTHRSSKKLLERLSVLLIIVAMIIIAIIAYRAVT